MKKTTMTIGLVAAGVFSLCSMHLLAAKQMVGLKGTDHVCHGHHYEQIDPTLNENGVKEYWVCCECNQIYYSTKAIEDYDAANWVDNGTYSGEEIASDDRNLGQLFPSSCYVAGDFTATKSDSAFTINGTNSSGSYLTSDEFYNCEFTVSFSEAASHNPWGNNNYTNSLIIGGKKHDTYLSGFFIDVCTSFTTIYEVEPNGTAKAASSITANPYTGSIQTFDVKVDAGVLTISSNGTTLVSAQSEYYMGGSLGFYNTNGSSASLTISNFSGSNVERSLFANGTYNSGNTWTATDDVSSFTVNGDGYALSHETYTNFNVSISMDHYAQNQSWDTSVHKAYNSLIIGGSVNDSGILSGFLVEFHTTYILIEKLAGTDNISITDDGAFNWISRDSSDNTFDISLAGSVIKYRSGSTYGSYTLDGYAGGHIGFLSNTDSVDGTNHVTATVLS